jgi:hypothetical protein
MKKGFFTCNHLSIVILLSAFVLHTVGSYASIQSNDAGVINYYQTSPSLTSNPSVIISQTFGDGTLPTPPGISTTYSGTQLGRLFRDASPTTCTTNTGFSIHSPTVSHAYEAYAFVAASNGCLNIDVTEFSSTNLYVGVYQGGFISSNPVLYCVGQQGSSVVGSFACPVIAGETYVLVVMESNSGGGNGSTYTISLDNVSGVAVPFSIWWIFALFVAIGAFTVYKFKLRRA